ncbi:unnamed protein product [Oncorhynchus mykiss]|uniref:Uncharacterized protein n=1 Tax=Oncorhynchus mykiss TaxID=8022 RepID=A0A060Z171_ONCMY|nr:unnamed protein product [Oncorhynchus mykiss]
MVGYWGFHDYGCRLCDCVGDCDPFTGYCMSGSDLDLYNLEGNSSELVRIFKADELFLPYTTQRNVSVRSRSWLTANSSAP